MGTPRSRIVDFLALVVAIGLAGGTATQASTQTYSSTRDASRLAKATATPTSTPTPTSTAKYSMTDLGTLGGFTTDAYAINGNGQIVGESLVQNNSGYHYHCSRHRQRVLQR